MPELAVQSLAAFLGGVILNFTPCVLPIIPMKVRTILAGTGQGYGRRSLTAMAFLGGSLSLFLALGFITVLLKLQWGFLFQSRLFVALVAILFVIAGISLVLRVQIPLPQFLYRLGGQGIGQAFISGALAGVLSTPCTGPFLGSVLAYTLTQPPQVTLWLFIAIGMGLAFPYVIVLLVPGLLERLPKSGPWTQRVEESLGFVLLGGALFFGLPLLDWEIEKPAWGLWAGTVVLWAVIHLLRGKNWGARLLPLAVAGLAVVAVTFSLTTTQAEELPWRPYSPDEIVQAAQAKRPVLVEFTADWCLNCKVLERTVYRDPEVLQAAEATDLLPLQVDLTQPSPRGEALLIRYGGAGIPFALVLDRTGRTVATFPDLFTAEALIGAIRRAANKEQ